MRWLPSPHAHHTHHGTLDRVHALPALCTHMHACPLCHPSMQVAVPGSLPRLHALHASSAPVHQCMCTCAARPAHLLHPAPKQGCVCEAGAVLVLRQAGHLVQRCIRRVAIHGRSTALQACMAAVKDTGVHVHADAWLCSHTQSCNPVCCMHVCRRSGDVCAYSMHVSMHVPCPSYCHW